MNRHKPDAVEAHFLDVIKLGSHAVQVANTVVVGIIVAVNENFIPVAIIIVDDIKGDTVFIVFVVPIEKLTGRKVKNGCKKGDK